MFTLPWYWQYCAVNVYITVVLAVLCGQCLHYRGTGSTVWSKFTLPWSGWEKAMLVAMKEGSEVAMKEGISQRRVNGNAPKADWDQTDFKLSYLQDAAPWCMQSNKKIVGKGRYLGQTWLLPVLEHYRSLEQLVDDNSGNCQAEGLVPQRLQDLRNKHKDIVEFKRAARYGQLNFTEELIRELGNIGPFDAVPIASRPPVFFKHAMNPEFMDKRGNCRLCYSTEKVKISTGIMN
ncbi:hypothetical protein Btru_063984 [Bulinus truncatus]|nr:hypothetical protein Btru_063984 [Bulinus truncatus]